MTSFKARESFCPWGSVNEIFLAMVKTEENAFKKFVTKIATVRMPGCYHESSASTALIQRLSQIILKASFNCFVIQFFSKVV